MLNVEQDQAAKDIHNFLKQPFKRDNFFCLSGPPGSGKTYMLDEALKGTTYLQGGTIAHSAKNVLQSSFNQNSIQCYTVAQLIGMNMQMNEDIITFVISGRAQPKIGINATLVLDEVSMINDYLFNKIMEQVNINRVKLIAVGDPFQLPPVGQEHDSRFFAKIDAQLIRSMRFDGSIGEIAKEIREIIDFITKEKSFNQYALDDSFLINTSHMTDGNGYRFENDIHSIVQTAAKEIDNNSDDKNYARILAYKNTSVKALNDGVREFIYGKHADQFEFNEIVISDGGFNKTTKPQFGRPFSTPIIYNGEILRVKGIDRGEGPYGIPCKYLNFEKSLETQIPVVENTAEAQRKYMEVSADLYQKGKEYNQWPQYREFLDSFANFNYAYATTLHKAQGMTLNKVYVLEGEIMGMQRLGWKQKFQALYVAMTRAKQELIIYNKKRT